jgi:hypothetical protein
MILGQGNCALIYGNEPLILISFISKCLSLY